MNGGNMGIVSQTLLVAYVRYQIRCENNTQDRVVDLEMKKQTTIAVCYVSAHPEQPESYMQVNLITYKASIKSEQYSS